MPSVSRKQQRLFGMVRAVQEHGEEPASEEVAELAKSMDKNDVKAFAETKHRGLPEKKKTKKEAAEKDVELLKNAVAPAPRKPSPEYWDGLWERDMFNRVERKLSEVLSNKERKVLSDYSRGKSGGPDFGASIPLTKSAGLQALWKSLSTQEKVKIVKALIQEDKSKGVRETKDEDTDEDEEYKVKQGSVLNNIIRTGILLMPKIAENSSRALASTDNRAVSENISYTRPTEGRWIGSVGPDGRMVYHRIRSKELEERQQQLADWHSQIKERIGQIQKRRQAVGGLGPDEYKLRADILTETAPHIRQEEREAFERGEKFVPPEYQESLSELEQRLDFIRKTTPRFIMDRMGAAETNPEYARIRELQNRLSDLRRRQIGAASSNWEEAEAELRKELGSDPVYIQQTQKWYPAGYVWNEELGDVVSPARQKNYERIKKVLSSIEAPEAATAQATPAQATPAQATPAQATPAQATPAQAASENRPRVERVRPLSDFYNRPWELAEYARRYLGASPEDVNELAYLAHRAYNPSTQPGPVTAEQEQDIATMEEYIRRTLPPQSPSAATQPTLTSPPAPQPTATQAAGYIPGTSSSLSTTLHTLGANQFNNKSLVPSPIGVFSGADIANQVASYAPRLVNLSPYFNPAAQLLTPTRRSRNGRAFRKVLPTMSITPRSSRESYA